MKLEESFIKNIQSHFSKIETKEDILKLLNIANRYIYLEKSSPITISQLNYYTNPNRCFQRYNSFEIKKKSGGTRQLNSPVLGLKRILKALNLIFQCVAEPHRLAFGFVKEKSIVDNAKNHLNKKYVYNIDLKDFFHSFDRNRVKLAFIYEPFNLNGDKEPLAFLLASLCTHPIVIEKELKIVLPQGSPTSPTLTNVLCVTLDRRLNGLAKKENAKYSRYADDITFSSDCNIFSKPSFQNELKRIVEENQSLVINPTKTRLQNKFYRQEVTGLTVGDKVNVQKRYVKQIRMWIYYWEKYGYLKAQQIFSVDYKKDKGHLSKNQPNLTNVLEGKLNYLKMVKGEDDSTYLKLKNRFTQLKDKNECFSLSEIITIWEKFGIEEAMSSYYSKDFILKPINTYKKLIIDQINFDDFNFNNNLIK